MLPADRTVLRLADPSARDGLLTSDALLAIAGTCYEIDPETVVGPATAVYDSFDLGVSISPTVSAMGRWGRATEPVPAEGTVSLLGLVAPSPGADAVWTGSVVVRTAGGDGVITSADVTDLGPDFRQNERLGVDVTFSPPAGVTPDSPPQILPVIVAFLVADEVASPRALLQLSEAARRAADRYPPAKPPSTAPARTRERCVCWLVPSSAFDDDGWPGGTTGSTEEKRAARAAAARTWLAIRGIALVAT